jgi:hypothetical protein
LDDLGLYKSFVNWVSDNLWKPVNCDNFDELCDKFYRQKTISRVDQYIEKNITIDKPEIMSVNNKSCGGVYDLLDQINWDKLSHIPTNLYHGDLQFDNIIYNDFGGSSDYGDVYYDLAKMYGGTLINYREMRSNTNANISVWDNNVSLNLIDNSPNLVELRGTGWLDRWIKTKGFDIKTVKILTSLIFLNMCPLHELPFGDYLFYKGKEMLYDNYR